MPERRITIVTDRRTTGFRIMSEILTEAGLTKYGRDPDRLPMRPHSPRYIAKLGRDLDRAERQLDEAVSLDVSKTAQATLRRRFDDAERRYGDAVNARVAFQKWSLEKAGRVPKSSDKNALEDARCSAEDRVDCASELGRLDYRRELIDANAAFMLADHAFDVARENFEEADLNHRRDVRDGIKRHRGGFTVSMRKG